MPDGATRAAPSTRFAATLLVEAVRGGVTDLVVCPGSRSQALALVAAELEALDRIRLHVRHDERSAGFFALGLARESGRAVPVITTSGTAVANLHPAMLEAFHAGVPLVALTADRPAELVGTGANQTTVQPGLFGDRIDLVAVDAPVGDPADDDAARALGRRIADARGPLHANVAFREPLGSALPDLAAMLDAEPLDAEPLDAERAHAAATASGDAADRTITIDPDDGVPTLVVAGDLAGPAAEDLAHRGGWPLIAEASSGARFGRNLVVAFRELLRADSPRPDLRDAVRRVFVFGHPTLSREVPQLIARTDVEVIVVGPTGGEPFGADDRIAHRVDRVDLAPSGEAHARDSQRAWLRAWVRASHDRAAAASSDAPAPALDASGTRVSADRPSFAKDELAIAREPVSRELLVDAVWRATWPHDRLVLGASRLIRVLDGRAPGKAIRVHANRGLAGIDGTIATALGVAAASQGDGTPAGEIGTTRVLLGDLALLHDASSLLVGQGGEAAPRLQLVVGNDGGGTIFDGLEVAAVAGADRMRRVQYTPHAADLGAIARAYGWHHVIAATRADLEGALSDRSNDRVVIEVPLPR